VTSPTVSTSQENHAGSVCAYDEADTYVVQSGNVHLSFFEDELKVELKV